MSYWFEENLKERLHAQALVRDRDPYLATGGHFFVQQYICQQLQQLGNVETHEFQARQTHQNLILNLLATPSDKQKQPVLIGAHYDAVPGTPGGMTQARGIAGVGKKIRS